MFADCVVARIVEYITSADSHQIARSPGIISNMIRVMKSWVLDKEIPPEQAEQKSLYNIFLEGIIRVNSKFPKDLERLKTINNLTLKDNWDSKGIFENTGICTEQNERYAHQNATIDNYGYCFGTKEEAIKRDLTLGPKKGILWGQGRVWEAVKEVAALEALPQGRAVSAQTAGFGQFTPVISGDAYSNLGAGAASGGAVLTQFQSSQQGGSSSGSQPKLESKDSKPGKS